MRHLASSLKGQLAIGAGLIGLVALAAVALAMIGMRQVDARIGISVAAERRIERYSVLSTQVSSFIVIAAEAIQRGLGPEARADRLDRLADDIAITFKRLRLDQERAMAELDSMGLDVQSRRATQSIGIARMEALFNNTHAGLLAEAAGRDRLQGQIDAFASGFDPLLNSVISAEMRIRGEIIDGIAGLRRTLTVAALGIAAMTLALLAGFYFGLVRPQFRRLDRLRSAAKQIGQGDFAIELPEERDDEIGALFAETNRMAAALAHRKAEVDREWTQLNATISERTAELRQAVSELARVDENRRRFFADIGHELRTPLTVILMEAEIGQTGRASPEQAFATIRARALRLNRRIDDMLRIARSDSGLLELADAPFDLAEATRDAVAEMKSALDSAGMTLTCAAEAPVIAQGDANWVRQVVAGLIQNALRHARAGGRIAVCVSRTGGSACVAVADNGPGVDPAEQAGIFERFQRGRGAAASEGFGIGLAFAAWVVQRQGGEITLQSPLSGADRLGDLPGTKVTVCIPLAWE